MDLGKAKLRKVGINNLNSGVHPQHGVIWTDGKSIFLAPIRVEGTHVQNATSVKLGEFEQVTSVHWSCCESSENNSACHLCVVHQHNVTVWRVSGGLPKLSFKQVRKINVRPIAQGCLWNPCNDVLCLLSRHQCSFYFRHDSNKASFAFPPLTSGKISCGCWTPDGKKLVMCVGSTLLVYRWNDVTAAIDDFTATAWPIPGLDGQVTSISPVNKDLVVVAAEVPLESLCKQSQDLLTMPDINGVTSTGDDGMIRALGNPSATQSLMNLTQNSQASGEGRSTLSLIYLQDGSCDITKITSAPLRGVLTPDILLYEKSSQCVVVGSNSQSQLHIYALLDKHLAYCGDIQLEKGQRPKGLCSMPTYFDEHGAALLILVGQRESEESSFLSAALEADFQLSLKYIILKAGYGNDGRTKRTSRTKGAKGLIKTHSSTSLTKSESMHETSKKHQNLTSLRTPVRHRSGSMKSDVQGRGSPSPNLTEFQSLERPNLTEFVASQDLNEKENISDRERINSNDVRIVIPDAATRDSLLSGSTPVLNQNHTESTTSLKSKKIEDISSSTRTRDPKSLEIETTSFSDQKASFQNKKLDNEFDLHRHSEIKSNQIKPPRESKIYASQPALQSAQSETQLPIDNSKSDIKNCVVEIRKDMHKMREYRKSGILRASPTSQSKSISAENLCLEGSISVNIHSENNDSVISKTKQADKLAGGDASLVEKNSNGIEILQIASRGLSQKDSSSDTVVHTKSKSYKTNKQPDSKQQQTFVVDSSDLKDDNKPQSEPGKDFSQSEDQGRDLSDSGIVDRMTPRDYASSEVKEETGSVGSDRGLGSSLHSSESYFDSIEKQVRIQKDSIDALQKRLADLSVSVDKSSCVFPTRYQDMANPEMVEVYCEKAEGTETKRFLLDNGRLQLEPLKLAFGLSTVELWLDGFPCVLGANIDGYIPIKFTASSRLHITGLPSL